MENLICTACNRYTNILHPDINLLYCEHCFKVFDRTQDGFSDKNTCAIIHPKNTRIQPGTTGQWRDRKFRVTGRCRLQFKESVFNYWTILFENSSLGWLLEGYGLFYIVPDLINQTADKTFPKIHKAAIDTSVQWSGGSFLVTQNQACKKFELEGQSFLPMTKKGFSVIALERTLGNDLLCFSNEEQSTYVYFVIPASEDELCLASLREINQEPYPFSCKHCDTRVMVHHYPYEQSVVCDNCGTGYYLKYSSFELGNVHFNAKKRNEIAIKIGARGSINGVTYTVRGFAEKKEKNVYQSKWREFYLQSEDCGYAILSEYDGHWIFIRELADTPVRSDPGNDSFVYDNRLFEKYNRYQYTLVYAAGSFPHNIFNNHETECFEYIAPPHILIYEQDPHDGIRWFYGEHIPNTDLRKIFTPTPVLPYKKGTGAVSPVFTDGISKSGLFLAALLAFVCILSLHLIIGQTKDKRVILPYTNYKFPDSADQINIVGSSFTLDKSSANLAFEISAPVSNSWFALSVNLINKDNGKVYSFEQGVEYYFGVSEGESWSEGSMLETYHLNKIPAGTYLLEMQGLREKQYLNALADFNLEVKYDVEEDANLWWALGLLAIWPLACFFLIDYNKQRRWMNSPFSNYNDES